MEPHSLDLDVGSFLHDAFNADKDFLALGITVVAN